MVLLGAAAHCGLRRCFGALWRVGTPGERGEIPSLFLSEMQEVNENGGTLAGRVRGEGTKDKGAEGRGPVPLCRRPVGLLLETVDSTSFLWACERSGEWEVAAQVGGSLICLVRLVSLDVSPLLCTPSWRRGSAAPASGLWAQLGLAGMWAGRLSRPGPTAATVQPSAGWG